MDGRDSLGSLRVAYVVPMGNGLHSFIHREIRELCSLGVEVHIFPTKTGTGPYPPMASWPVHRVRLVPLATAHLRTLIRSPARYLEVLREAIGFRGLLDFAIGVFFAQFVTQLDLGVVHCHFGDHKFFIGYFCSRIAEKPLTVTIHAYELYGNPNPRLFHRALERASAIVTVAEHNREVLERGHQAPSKLIRVIPLFADIPQGPTPKHSADEKIVVLMVARFVEKKGHRILFEALRRLPGNFEAWIVGAGPLDVRLLARRSGVATRVRFLGRLTDEDLERTYGAATVFCLPSETSVTGDQEGIPVALMEAMAHGLPVVATRHAGIPELVEEILVNEGDATQLALGLLQLGQSPELRVRLSQRNREIVASRFSRRNVLL